MTSHVARLYALVVAVLAFFLAWAAVVAHPWATTGTTATAKDPRIAALVARQKRVHLESIRVQRLVQARWAVYRRALARRNAAAAAATARATAVSTARRNQLVSAAAAPSVRVVTLPPLTVTRVS